MQTSITTNAFITFLMIFCASVHAGVADDWQRTKKSDTAEAYATFLEKHANSKFTKEATAALRRARFDFVKMANDPRAYETFIQLYPSGNDVEEVKNLLLAHKQKALSAAASVPDRSNQKTSSRGTNEAREKSWRLSPVAVIGLLTVAGLISLLVVRIRRKGRQLNSAPNVTQKNNVPTQVPEKYPKTTIGTLGTVAKSEAMSNSRTIRSNPIKTVPARRGSILCKNPQCREIYDLEHIVTVSDDDVMNFLSGGGGTVIGRLSGHPVLVDHSRTESSAGDLNGLLSEAPRFGWTCNKCKANNKWAPSVVDGPTDITERNSEVEMVKNRMKSHSDYEALKNLAAGPGLSGDDVADIIASVIAKNHRK